MFGIFGYKYANTACNDRNRWSFGTTDLCLRIITSFRRISGNFNCDHGCVKYHDM